MADPDSDSDWEGSGYSEFPRPPRIMTSPLPPPSRDSFRNTLCEAMRDEFRVLGTELRNDIKNILLRMLPPSPLPPDAPLAPMPMASPCFRQASPALGPWAVPGHGLIPRSASRPLPTAPAQDCRETQKSKRTFKRFQKNEDDFVDVDVDFTLSKAVAKSMADRISETIGVSSFSPKHLLGDTVHSRADTNNSSSKPDLRKVGLTALGDGWSDANFLGDGILTPPEDIINANRFQTELWVDGTSVDSSPSHDGRNAVEAWPVSPPGQPVSLDFDKGKVHPVVELGSQPPIIHRSTTRSIKAQQKADMTRKFCFRRTVYKIVTHSMFEWVAMLLVFGNAAVAGVGTDYIARNVNSDLPDIYQKVDRVFLFFFTIELSMRLIAHGWKFFRMWGWAWNLYDLVLVSLQLIEEVLLFFSSSFFGDDGGVVFTGSVLRVVRILRTIRVIRILRVMRFTEDLQVLVSCISHSMKSFSWAVSLLLLLIYVASIYLAQSVAQARAEGGLTEQSDWDLQYWYGTLLITVLSLFQALTGGVDWNDVVRPLFEEVSWFTGMVILAWIAFALLVIMNIFTGVFVDTALRRLEEVRETAKVRHARSMFEKMDMDSSGTIRFEEISQHTGLEEVQEFFRDIDVDVSEAQALFELLDSDGSGCLDFEEFLSGCLRLQGSARSVDLLLVAKENRVSFSRQAEALNEIQRVLKALLTPQIFDADGIDVDATDSKAPRYSAIKPPELAHLTRPRTPVETALLTSTPFSYEDYTTKGSGLTTV